MDLVVADLPPTPLGNTSRDHGRTTGRLIATDCNFKNAPPRKRATAETRLKNCPRSRRFGVVAADPVGPIPAYGSTMRMQGCREKVLRTRVFTSRCSYSQCPSEDMGLPNVRRAHICMNVPCSSFVIDGSPDARVGQFVNFHWCSCLMLCF